jgi:hypothetical protein
VSHRNLPAPIEVHRSCVGAEQTFLLASPATYEKSQGVTLRYIACVAEFTSTMLKHAACGGADVAKSVFLLGLSTGPIRVLRAAWRPCSRGRPDVRW